MTDFMAKMHQIRYRLGRRPYSAFIPLDVFGGLLLREEEGRGGEGEERSHCSCFTK